MFQYPVKIRKVAIIANTNDYVKTNIKPLVFVVCLGAFFKCKK